MTTAGYACSVLHGKVEGTDRDATMEDFRLGKSKVLITTNVLARGVNVDNVDVVINYDPRKSKRENRYCCCCCYECYTIQYFLRQSYVLLKRCNLIDSGGQKQTARL